MDRECVANTAKILENSNGFLNQCHLFFSCLDNDVRWQGRLNNGKLSTVFGSPSFSIYHSHVSLRLRSRVTRYVSRCGLSLFFTRDTTDTSTYERGSKNSNMTRKIVLYLFHMYAWITVCDAQDILGCGGFLKSHAHIDFAKVQIKL